MATIRITEKSYSGASKMFDGSLARTLRALAQNQAVTAAAAIADLTDSVGGASNGTIDPIGNVTNAVLGTTDCVQKAGLETALGTVRDAISEVIKQLNAIRAVIPAFGAITDSTGGAAGDGTVGAVTVSLTAVGTSLASAAGSKTVITNLKNRVNQAAYFVNALAKAVGATPVIDKSGGSSSYGTTFAAVALDTGTAVTGADTTNANAGIKKTDGDAVLVLLRDACKELVVKLNEVTSGAPKITVIAG